MSDAIVRMPIEIFRDDGYLQELNRLFLHPRGLALEVVVDDETNIMTLGGVWDYRNDPEGMEYGENLTCTAEFKAKVRMQQRIVKERRPVREAQLGYWIQPVTGNDAAATVEPPEDATYWRDRFMDANAEATKRFKNEGALRGEVARLRERLERAELYNMTDGCSTGDCPHDNVNDCVAAQAKIIGGQARELEDVREELAQVKLKAAADWLKAYLFALMERTYREGWERCNEQSKRPDYPEVSVEKDWLASHAYASLHATDKKEIAP